MKHIKETFWERLHNRLHPDMAAKHERALRRSLIGGPIDFVAVYDLEAMLLRARTNMRLAIQHLREMDSEAAILDITAAHRSYQRETAEKFAGFAWQQYRDIQADLADLRRIERFDPIVDRHTK